MTRRPAPEVVREVAGRLRGRVAAPDVDARQLVAHVVGRPASQLLLADVAADQLHIIDALAERRAAGEPLQHLTGRAAFRTIEVEVGPEVFIPRPETEMMVQAAIDWIHAEGLTTARIVDLCTGSGVIAKSLAAELPDAQIHAVELSDEALAWARHNLAGTGVTVHAGDIADALPGEDESFDLVIANPPYVPLEAWESVPAEVRDHDPTLALFSGQDGLDAMRVLSTVAQRLLRPDGLLLAEHAEVQHEAVVDLFTADGWGQVRDNRDLTDRWRFVSARRARRSVA